MQDKTETKKEVKIGKKVIRLGEDGLLLTPSERKLEPQQFVEELKEELEKTKIFPESSE